LDASGSLASHIRMSWIAVASLSGSMSVDKVGWSSVCVLSSAGGRVAGSMRPRTSLTDLLDAVEEVFTVGAVKFRLESLFLRRVGLTMVLTSKMMSVADAVGSILIPAWKIIHSCFRQRKIEVWGWRLALGSDQGRRRCRCLFRWTVGRDW
jgi:hypothetical protein